MPLNLPIFPDPVITTITQPAYEMGMQAAKIFLSCIEKSGDAVSDYIVFHLLYNKENPLEIT